MQFFDDLRVFKDRLAADAHRIFTHADKTGDQKAVEALLCGKDG